tara:strand:- start:244 stop:735 length:492 start_codon:yes stop_codon:yes gene_type:complete
MITEDDYEIFIRYAKSLLFKDSQVSPQDIVHNVILKGIQENHSIRYMMYNIRMSVLGKDRGRRVTTEVMPPQTVEPSAPKEIEVNEFMTALDNIRIYRRGGDRGRSKTVDTSKTNKAKTIVRMSYEGYSQKEISEVVDMNSVAISNLRLKVMKRIKKQLEIKG